MTARFLNGSIFDLVDDIPPFQCLVTSPPYYAKRHYDIPDVYISPDPLYCDPKNCDADQWVECDPPRHRNATDAGGKQANANGAYDARPSYRCEECGTWKGQLGQESTVTGFIIHLGDLFLRLAERMADDGTMWINIGDTWSNNPKAGAPQKGLFGVPWRLAIYLQDNGLIWRNHIVWKKASSMPESMDDRLSSQSESILLFSKQPRYKFNKKAVLLPHAESSLRRYDYGFSGKGKFNRHSTLDNGITRKRDQMWDMIDKDGVALRDVWDINTSCHDSEVGDHVAVMPHEIPRRCILLGSDPGDVIFDPFGGTGTVAAVATQLGRGAVSVDLDGRSEDFYNEHLAKTTLTGDQRVITRERTHPKTTPPPGQGDLL